MKGEANLSFGNSLSTFVKMMIEKKAKKTKISTITGEKKGQSFQSFEGHNTRVSAPTLRRLEVLL